MNYFVHRVFWAKGRIDASDSDVDEGIAMRCVELFTGCGGLALGLSRSGFSALRMSEWDKHAVANVQHNRDRKIAHVSKWPIQQEDVRGVDWSSFKALDLVAGGPPCQPFSVGGRHLGHHDVRDMWPEAVRAVRETQPQGFIFENVRGLTRPAFAAYLEWVTLSLSLPNVLMANNESWEDHLSRLRPLRAEAAYDVTVQKVNAADFGAAQQRHRVIIMGMRRDLAAPTPLLQPTHARDRLLWDQWVTGTYWERHGLLKPETGPMRIDLALVRKLKQLAVEPKSSPWRTIRDAISGLGEPGSLGVLNHSPQAGAKAYPGHTGSPIDMPAKALKAGVHGVPGGENMMAMPDGSVRYFTVREAARLQGLPDDYEFVGSWSENMRQCGNAVPVELAEAAGRAMVRVISEARAGSSRASRAA